MRRRMSAVALAVTVALPLLGGCGIQESDVIEAGGPASVQAFLNREYDMLLFFRSPDGDLSPVIRTTGPSAGFDGAYETAGSDGQNTGDPEGPVPTEKVVLALLAGPRELDRAAGLSTALPALTRGGPVVIGPPAGGSVTARLPLPLAGLDSTALRQLTCTIAYSEDPEGQVVVELNGQDGTSRSGTCGLAPAASRTSP